MVIQIDRFCWKNADSEHIFGYIRIFSWLNGQKTNGQPNCSVSYNRLPEPKSWVTLSFLFWFSYFIDELFGLVDFFLSPPKRNCNIFLLTTILILSQIMTYMSETLPAFPFSVETFTILVELSCPAFVNHTYFHFLYVSNNMTISNPTLFTQETQTCGKACRGWHASSDWGGEALRRSILLHLFHGCWF